jgi:hypothetical protein
VIAYKLLFRTLRISVIRANQIVPALRTVAFFTGNTCETKYTSATALEPTVIRKQKTPELQVRGFQYYNLLTYDLHQLY